MPYKDPIVRREYYLAWKRRVRVRYRDHEKAYSAALHANRRAQKYGAPGEITTEEAAAILAVNRCHYCGAESPFWLGLDHVIPLFAGGLNRPENIVPCCHSCNASKFRQDAPYRWAREYDCCIQCSTTERPHLCHGLCARCHRRSRKKAAA